MNRRKILPIAITLFVVAGVLMLAMASTTWAAPGAQGTVPTAPANTPAPGETPGGGGGDSEGGSTGGDSSGTGGDTGSGGTTTGGTPAAPAAAAAPGAGSVCVIGGTGAQCSATDVFVVVNSGAAPAGSALTIEGSFAQPPCPASPAGQTFMNSCYRYTWLDTNVQPLSAVNAPVQYCLSYNAAQLNLVKNNPDSFLIGFAGEDGNWSLVKPTADTANSRTCATTTSMARWSALFAPTGASDLLPTVGGTTNLVGWIVAGAAGVLLLFAATRLLSKRASKI